MPKPKNQKIEIKQKQPKEIIYEDSDNDSDQNQIGTVFQRKDYITLKKNKPKPLLSSQQNQLAAELFRNDEVQKYLARIEIQDKNMKKKPKSKSDGRQEVIDNVFAHLKRAWNVCLTGGMDKMQILNDIVDLLENNQQYVFVIHGFAQPLNEKKIYNAFGSYLIAAGFAETIDNVLLKDQLEQYEKILKSTPEDTIIYVVFYDISNYGFLTSQMQQKISNLLALPRLRVISSIENCKIVLNWSLNTIQTYNFIFIDTNKTCIPITKLLRYMPLPSEKVQKTQIQISQIWKSLNRNQRQIAVILAENQLHNIISSEQNYLTFQQLLDACIDKIILSDDHQLRQNLVQLIDHRVVIQEIDKLKNKKTFIMKLDRRILQSMINGKYDTYEFQSNNNR